MKKISFFILAILLVGLAGCEKENPEKKLYFPKLSIVNGASNLKSGSDVQGMFFHEMEIVAYHYRPGQTIQNRPQDAAYILGFQRDWSFFNFLPKGFEKSKNIVLTQSGEINIRDLLTIDYYDDPWFYLDSAYVEKVDTFTMDILQVNFFGTGVIKNNKFYGSWLGDAPLSKYPQFSNIPTFPAYTYFPGIEDHAFTVSCLFVSEKFISSPVLIIAREVGQNSYGVFSWEIEKTTRTLSAGEKAFMQSFLDNGLAVGYATYLIVIPFTGERKWQFTNDNFLSSIKVSLDLNSIVDDVRTNFSAIEAIPAGGPYQYDPLYYKTDSNYIPFGLNIIF